MSTASGSWASRPHALTRSTAGRLNTPRPALVEAGVDGTPCVVNRQQVAFVREEWRVVDRWWTEEPLDRRYYEVVLESGQNVCVYRDRERGCWFTQRGMRRSGDDLASGEARRQSALRARAGFSRSSGSVLTRAPPAAPSDPGRAPRRRAPPIHRPAPAAPPPTGETPRRARTGRRGALRAAPVRAGARPGRSA